MFGSTLYSLRKSRNILNSSYTLYKKRGGKIPAETRREFEELMEKLDKAVLEKDRLEADRLARKLERGYDHRLKKNLLDYGKELAVALLFALIIATVVRQMWFELYEIPTGSMRPTFEEQDHLTVTKTAFGINVPLMTRHFYFNPELVQRTSVVIFSGDNIDLPNTDTTYFGIFPYKKRYIKRLIGKPGDSLYFYGGQLYGVDKEGKMIEGLRDAPWMEDLEYIPFLNFDGRVRVDNGKGVVFKQMNRPVAKLTRSMNGPRAEIFDGEGWVPDDPQAQLKPHDKVEGYSDFWGIRNYAMARILRKEQAELPDQEAELVLELAHTPMPSRFNPRELSSRYIATERSLLPLEQRHLDAIAENLYTARFVVQNGYAARYSAGGTQFDNFSPRLPGVPDGTYEFYHGKAYRVGFGGILTELSGSHPLYSRSPEMIRKLFNLGMEVNSAFSPDGGNKDLFPSRYAYFREGDLYLLGAPVFMEDDPALAAFHEREKRRAETSIYIPFKDYGPPHDAAFIRAFGVTIPEHHYMVLGDNHAMSADSRVFGFVPQQNLQGAPSLILWPPGERMGLPAQKPYPIFNIQRTAVWTVAAAIGIGCFFYCRRKRRRPIYRKIDFDR